MNCDGKILVSRNGLRFTVVVFIEFLGFYFYHLDWCGLSINGWLCSSAKDCLESPKRVLRWETFPAVMNLFRSLRNFSIAAWARSNSV